MRGRPGLSDMRRHHLHPPHPALIVAVALVVAAISLIFHDTLKADPQGWLRWGRSLALGDGTFSTAGYPSWKPLAALLTTPLALTGSAAPDLWLVLMRVGGLLALLLTGRLAFRLGGPVAAGVALLALVLVPNWWPTLLGGQIEPALLALGLLALDRHLAGRPRQALLLGALVALGREEAWPLLALYALWAVREDRGLLPAAAGALVVVPVLWLGGDWIGSGSAIHGGVIAGQAPDAAAQRSAGSVPGYTLELAADLLLVPLWAAVAAGLARALRGGEGLVLALVGAAVAWVGIDVLVSALGLPGETRFMLPAAGLLSVVAGVGAAAVVRAALAPSRPSGPPLHALAQHPASASMDWAPGRAGPPLPC